MHYCVRLCTQSVPTSNRHIHRLCFCLVTLDLSLQVALRPLSEQTEQRFAPLPPRVTKAKLRHCAAHRPADTATQPARDLPLGHRVDIY